MLDYFCLAVLRLDGNVVLVISLVSCCVVKYQVLFSLHYPIKQYFQLFLHILLPIYI